MIRIIMIITVLLSGLVAEAQTPNWNETFRQKRTQRTYLIKQIALLRTYLSYVKKGYEIADKGLNLIGDIKAGTFKLDQDYFNSLKEINPLIKNSPKVNEILTYQQSITKGFQKLLTYCNSSPEFTQKEIDYIQAVYNNMLMECSNSIDELTMIATAGKAEMKDDERLTRLDKIHSDMIDKYTFTQTFIDGTQLLSLQRAKQRTEVGTLKDLHQ